MTGSLNRPSNASQFNALYNQLDRYLRAKYDIDPGLRFWEMIDYVSVRDSAVRANAWWLKDFGSLRNAIIHRQNGVEEPIAEPHTDVLEKFARYVHHITSPELVTMRASPVHIFEESSILSEILACMLKNEYSQIVFRKNGRFALLTVEGVTRWLAVEAERDAGRIIASTATAGDAHVCEWDDNVAFIAKNRSVYDAREILRAPPNSKRSRLYAILVTETGRDDETPIGIVTPWDIAHVGLG